MQGFGIFSKFVFQNLAHGVTWQLFKDDVGFWVFEPCQLFTANFPGFQFIEGHP